MWRRRLTEAELKARQLGQYQLVEKIGEGGMSVDEITEVFDVTPEEVKAVLHFASQSLAKAPAFG